MNKIIHSFKKYFFKRYLPFVYVLVVNHFNELNNSKLMNKSHSNNIYFTISYKSY